MTIAHGRTKRFSQHGPTPSGSRRCFSFPLVEPIRIGGHAVDAVNIRLADVDDILALGASEVVDRSGRVDVTRCREWFARLSGVELVGKKVSDRDVLAWALTVDGFIGPAREAFVPGPLSVSLRLETPISISTGIVIHQLRLRPALGSDAASLGGWGPALRMQNTGRNVHVHVDWHWLAAWASRLSGLSIEDLRLLSPVDAIALLRAVDDAISIGEGRFAAPN